MKKIVSSILTGILTAAIGSTCAGADSFTPNQDAINTVKTDEALRIVMMSEPSTLWGGGVGKLENEDVYLSSLLYDTLVILDQESGEVQPSLAESWNWEDDTHCTFVLRDDVIMADGSALTADDVVYTTNVWKEQSAATDTGRYIAGAEALDDHTVTIEYNVAAPDLLVMMGWPQFGIVSEEEVNAAGGIQEAQRKPVMGSGRYRFVEWKAGESITFTRNEEYWDPNYTGYFKDIVVLFASDSSGRTMTVQSGDVDVALDIPIVEADAAANSSVKEYLYTSGQVSHLWYNMGERAGATKDLRVRQAIDKALNFEALAGIATAGHQTQELGYAGAASRFYTPTWTEEERAVDLEGAKALLEDAGYADGLTLRALALSTDINTLTVMQANLAAVGITLELDTPDVAQFVEQAFSGDYDIIPVGETLVTRAPNVLPFITKANIEGPGVVIGGPKWTTDELNDMITAFVSEKDADRATEVLAEIDLMLKEQMVCSHLYTEMKAALTTESIKGFRTRDERAYPDLTTFYK